MESVGQIAKLCNAGCTQIQGYVFSPPRPANDIIAMFESRLEGYENGSIVACAKAG